MRILVFTFLLCCVQPLSAQLQNDNINFIWRINQAFADFDDPEVFEGEEEYTMTFAQGNGDQSPADYPLCYAFDGDGSASFTPTSITNNFGENQDPTDDFWIYLFAWEDDGGERCEFDDGDDALNIGLAQISGGTVPGTGGPSQWLTNTGNFGSECVGEALLPFTGQFNFCYSLIWRYEAGDSADDPLIFNSNFVTGAKSNISSNRTGEGTGGNSYYSNQYGEPSPDVHYSFQLTQDYANVVISTDFPETNFDTKIYLLNDLGLIEENDDIDGANNRKSKIERGLCAGFYQVVVEGFDVNTGDFKIEVDATGFVGPLETATTLVPATCPDATDGQLMVEASGGIGPYTYVLVPNSGNDLIDFDGTYNELQAGEGYYYRVTDFCGEVVDSDNFTVAADDNVNPVAVCVGATLTLNDNDGTTELTPGEITQLGNQSTDNCGEITEVTIFPTEISPADAPIFFYELTVRDAAGNLNTALCELNINVVSNVSQLPALDAALTTYPNPATDWLNVKLDNISLTKAELYLRDPLGRQVYYLPLERVNQSFQTQIDLSQLAAGVYTLQIETPEGQLTRRIVKN